MVFGKFFFIVFVVFVLSFVFKMDSNEVNLLFLNICVL